MYDSNFRRSPANGLGRKRSLVAIERTPTGSRFYMLGLRWHHGLFGVQLALAGLIAIVLGLRLCWHDMVDWPWRLTD